MTGKRAGLGRLDGAGGCRAPGRLPGGTFRPGVAAWAMAFCLFGCAAEAADPGPVASPWGIPWDEQNANERLTYMTEVVLPTMQELFRREDPVRYADFDCDSCHGPDPIGSRFQMPVALYPLTLDDPIGSGDARDPDATTFMLIEVLPAMADLLGRPRLDEETAPEGVGCHACHLVAP